MTEEKFEFSGLPRNLEWYECYDDLASKRWSDGEERERLIENPPNDRALNKWDFFYRPFLPALGRPQKKRIRERQATIEACTAQEEEATRAIEAAQKEQRRASRMFAACSVVIAVFAVYLAFVSKWWLLVPIIPELTLVFVFGPEHRRLRSKIRDLQARIHTATTTIETCRKEIRLLDGEITELASQIPAPTDPGTIEEWLNEEIGEMELGCLSDLVGQEVTKENIGDYLDRSFGDKRVFGILLDSWGFLQPVTQRGPLGKEATGLGRAWQELHERVATWQLGKGGAPVFRLLFLQYIFPLPKNLNICSFFYDFVTRRTYGNRFETFQYNHVSNFSIREVEPQPAAWAGVQGLAEMADHLSGKTPKALTIAVTSGSHFQCVLVDKDIVNVLNEWMEHEAKFRSLQESLLDDLELEQRFDHDTQRIEEWKEKERLRIEEEVKDLVRERQLIQWDGARTSQTILNQVRNSVEEYVIRVQEPA